MIYLYIAIIVFSPYLAFLPMVYSGFKVLQRGVIIVKNDWNFGLLFLFIWSLFVGIINMDGISAVSSFAFLCYFFVSVYLQNNWSSEEKVEKLFNIVIVTSLGSGFIGLLERFTTLHNNPTWWKELFGIYPQVLFYERYRISGTFGNPNVAGTWYAALILICFYFFYNSKGFKKAYYGISMAIFVELLTFTSSRGAMIGLILGMMAYAFFLGHKKNMTMLSITLMFGVALMFIFPDWFPRGSNLINSIKDRMNIWINCLNLFKVKPFTGWGLLGIYFADGNIYQYTRTFHGHNIWITLATTLGVIGLGVFIYLECYIFDQLILLSKNKCRLVPLLAGLQMIIIGQGLMDFTIMNPQGGIVFFGCSAIITSLALQYSTVPVEEYSFILGKLKDKWHNS